MDPGDLLLYLAYIAGAGRPAVSEERTGLIDVE